MKERSEERKMRSKRIYEGSWVQRADRYKHESGRKRRTETLHFNTRVLQRSRYHKKGPPSVGRFRWYTHVWAVRRCAIGRV